MRTHTTYRTPAGFKRPMALIAIAALAAACSSSPSSSSTTSTSAKTATHGTASVAYAGSLEKLYNVTLGPAFERSTGDKFGGPPGAGSFALASEILDNEITPGVFLSVGAAAIEKLWPSGRSKFALALATDPLVVAYSAKSRYFSQLNAIRKGARPLSALFSLFLSPGFKLGRTDPTQDPQGAYFILMTELAQTQLRLPSGEAAKALGISSSSPFGSSSQIFDETSLPTDISTGAVDAGSDFVSEAKQYGLDYITLPRKLDFASPAELPLYKTVSLKVSGQERAGDLINLDATLVAPTKGASVSAADRAADQTFVAFLLSSKGRSTLRAAGYTLVPPVLRLPPALKTASAALPPGVLSLYNSLGGSISGP